MHVHEALVKDIKWSKFAMSQAGCLFCPPGVFGRSECLIEKGSSLLGAFSRIEFSGLQILRSQVLGPVRLERIRRPRPRTL